MSLTLLVGSRSDADDYLSTNSQDAKTRFIFTYPESYENIKG
jgi:hypothetical protein